MTRKLDIPDALCKGLNEGKVLSGSSFVLNSLWLKRSFMIALFLLLYAVHAGTFLAISKIQYTELTILNLGAVVSLVLLVLYTVGDLVRRDEVVKHMVIRAGAIAGLGIGFLSYGIAAFAIDAPMVVEHLWAVGILIFLVVYGAHVWLARS